MRGGGVGVTSPVAGLTVGSAVGDWRRPQSAQAGSVASPFGVEVAVARAGGKVETGRVGMGVAVLVSVAVGEGVGEAVALAVGVEPTRGDAVVVGVGGREVLGGRKVGVAVGRGGGEVGVGGREVLVGRRVGVAVGKAGVWVGSSVGVRLGGRVGGARRAISPAPRASDKAGASAVARGAASARRAARSAVAMKSAKLIPQSHLRTTFFSAFTLHLASDT